MLNGKEGRLLRRNNDYDRVILLDGKELSVSQKRYSQMKVQYLSWKNKNWGNAR